MKDEINEILDYLRKYVDSPDTGEVIESKYTMNLLLDYITNLQEENERLKQPQVFIDTMDMEERYGQELYEDYLKEQLEDYKSRNKKAIEYITTEQLYTNYQWGKSQYVKILKDLLDILQGEDKE